MATSLIPSLGLHFGIQALVICHDAIRSDDVSLIAQLTRQWPSVLITSKSEVPLLSKEVMEEKVMIVCDLPEEQVPKAAFSSSVVWLIENDPSSVPSDIATKHPLSLESNLLVYDHDDARGITSIFEIYCVKSQVPKKTLLGYWSESGGLLVPEPTKWERRSNLSGVTLVNVVLEWEPMINVAEDNVMLTGLFPDIIHAIQDYLGFR